MRSPEEVRQNAVIHARLERLKSQVESEILRLRDSHAERSLRRQASRLEKEVSWALSWSSAISKPQNDSRWAWLAGLAGIAWGVYHWWAMLKDDFSMRNVAGVAAFFLLSVAHQSYADSRNQRAYERLLPWLMGGEMSVSDLLMSMPTQPA
jgi:hypothetical protein